MTAEREVSDIEAAALLAPLAEASRVLLAVSGGGDSLALLVLAARWANEPGRPALAVATVDHGLRRAAGAECARVADLACRLQLPHAVLTWSGPKPQRGIEAAARAARYALLDAHARAIGASHLVTAHTRDDQAETVLLRLAAGSGPAGLAAMRPLSRRGALVHARPLLDVPKSRLLATLRAADIAWCEDDSNRDPAFARARLRAGRALLDREGLTDARLARLAVRAARADDAIATAADTAWLDVAAISSSLVEIALPRLLVLPAEVRLRIIGRALAHVGGGDIRLARLEALVFALERAHAEGHAAVRTLAGARIAVGAGRMAISAAAPRGRAAASRRETRRDDATASLGNR